MNTLHIDCSGYSIVADWYEGRTNDDIILFLMGFTSTRKHQEDIVNAIVQNTGRSVLVIDYSGHGDSPFDLKDTRPAQHLMEAVVSYDWIKTRYPNAKISIVSASYGAFLAAHLINYRPVEQLVLRVPAIYQPDRLYDLWGSRLADENTYRMAIQSYRTNVSALKTHPIITNATQFKGKTMVVVHSEDETIPVEVTDVFTDAFNADIYTAEGFKHAVSHSSPTGLQMDAYKNAISDWLND